jgi:hypothetical protein
MSDVSKKIVGSSSVRKDADYDTYITEFYVREEDLDDYIPEIDDVADWAPVAARVSSFEKKELVEGRYILTVEAKPDESAGFSGPGGIKNNITDTFEWKYEDREMYYHPRLWGVRRATEADIKKSAKNIYGKTAEINDFIFRNYAKDSDLKGTPDYSESPFSSKNHPSIKLIGHKREISHFIVTFYSQKSTQLLTRFCGINGKFPSALDVYNGGVPGKWRLKKQKLASYTHNGEVYVKVTRTFRYAWGGLWDPDKCIGYWKSWEKGGIKED